MATSSIPRVKARLVERLDAAEWPGDRPQVTYGWPRDEQRELVAVVGTSERSEQTTAALGGRSRNEDYGLQVIITVQNPGLTQQQATERAFELLGVVEDVLRDDPTLGLGGLFVAEIDQPDLREAPAAEGYVAQVLARVRVRARI